MNHYQAVSEALIQEATPIFLSYLYDVFKGYAHPEMRHYLKSFSKIDVSCGAYRLRGIKPFANCVYTKQLALFDKIRHEIVKKLDTETDIKRKMKLKQAIARIDAEMERIKTRLPIYQEKK